MKLICTTSVTWLQLALLVDVKVKFTKPAVSSAALGEYIAFKLVLLGVNVPVPLDQIPVVVVPDTTPERAVAALFLQEDKSIPALTTGALLIIIITWSTTWLQLPLPDEVKDKLTTPDVTSAAVGIYVGLSTELLGVKVPVPPDQIPVVVGPEIVPESTDARLFLQT